jgi:hypothetical protein
MSRLKQNKASKSLGEQPPASNNLAARCSIEPWQPHLSQYEETSILIFSSAKELEAAIDLLWTSNLRNLPHETPDGNSLVVPAEAIEYFRQAGLRFTDKRVRNVTELPTGEIRRLRK